MKPPLTIIQPYYPPKEAEADCAGDMAAARGFSAARSHSPNMANGSAAGAKIFESNLKENAVKMNILKGYEDAAADLIERFEAVSSADLFMTVRDHLPRQPSRVLDIGAGTGRDAAWFASQSHAVVAVEPVDALRKAGMSRHGSPKIVWVNDTLPHLSRTVELGIQFDFIVLSAVWQHLDNADRQVAFSALQRLTSERGKVVMSLRHGPGARTRPVYPVGVSDTQLLAERNWFSKRYEAPMPSAQQQNQENSVTWTWLVFQMRRGRNQDGQ